MDVGHDTMSVELAGSPSKIDDFLALMEPYGIVELARSGVVSMERSSKSVPRASASVVGADNGSTGSSSHEESGQK
jgi:acetolactate synthase I/III small subunit